MHINIIIFSPANLCVAIKLVLKWLAEVNYHSNTYVSCHAVNGNSSSSHTHIQLNEQKINWDTANINWWTSWRKTKYWNKWSNNRERKDVMQTWDTGFSGWIPDFKLLVWKIQIWSPAVMHYCSICLTKGFCGNRAGWHTSLTVMEQINSLTIDSFHMNL
jgi:hypothetical protein